MTEIAERASPSAKRVGVTAFLQENLGIALSAFTAFLIFTGNGYYSTLLSGIGLHRGLLEIGQPEIATTGFLAAIFSCVTAISENWKLFGWSMLITLLSIIFVCVAYFKSAPLRAALSRISGTVGMVNTALLKGCVILFFVLIGLGAGSVAGKHDVKAFNGQRSHAIRCYYVDGIPYRSVLLIQDRARTVLLHPDRTSIVANDRLSMVRDCPIDKR